MNDMFQRVYEPNDGHDGLDVYPSAHHPVILADLECLLVANELPSWFADDVADIMEAEHVHPWRAVNMLKERLGLEGAATE